MKDVDAVNRLGDDALLERAILRAAQVAFALKSMMLLVMPAASSADDERANGLTHAVF